MNLPNLTAVVAVLLSGMLAGNEFAIAAFVHPALARLDDATHAKAVRAIATVTGRAMPFFYAAATISGLGMVITLPAAGCRWWLSAIACGLLVASIAFTLIGPLPINNRIVAWDLNALPAEWKSDRMRWDRLHRIRVVMLVAAALLLAGA